MIVDELKRKAVKPDELGVWGDKLLKLVLRVEFFLIFMFKKLTHI
jgi:hypothetical protein